MRAGLSAMLAAGAITGCTKSSEQAAAQALASAPVRALLAKIPADTPYALIGFGDASIKPFIERIYKGMGPLVDQMGTTLNQIPISGDHGPLIRAILAELRTVMQDGNLDKIGVDIDGRYAFYGIGLMPAVRWTLKDPALLREMLGRVQQAGGVTFPTCKLGDVEYWCGGDEKLKVAAAVVGSELVLGVAPTAVADKVFGILLGTTPPERSLADSPKVKDAMGAWGLSRFNVGFVDTRVIAESFLGEGDPLGREVLAALDPRLAGRWPQVSAVCKEEIRGLAAIAPMMVFGTESFGADGFSGLFALELRSDVARDLVSLRAPVAGLLPETRQGALFAMGGGADVGKSIDLVVRRAQEITKAPFQCEHLADLNRAASEAAQGPGKDLPPFVAQLRGFSFVAQDVKMSGFLPSSVQGYGVLATPDPKAVYELARAKEASLAQYTFSDDGKVTTLPDGTIPFVNGLAYAAKTGKGFAVAVGQGSEATVSRLLSEPDAKDPPLAVISYDLSKMMEAIAPLAAMGGSPEITKLLDVYKMFGEATMEVTATERGVMVRSAMKLK